MRMYNARDYAQFRTGTSNTKAISVWYRCLQVLCLRFLWYGDLKKKNKQALSQLRKSLLIFRLLYVLESNLINVFSYRIRIYVLEYTGPFTGNGYTRLSSQCINYRATYLRWK